MNDRELLELAAKAAGIEYNTKANTPQYNDMLTLDTAARFWRPLDDDGDALRLAVKLRLTVLESSVRKPDGGVVNVFPGEAEDRHAATRRAIVRAAAEIGRSMP